MIRSDKVAHCFDRAATRYDDLAIVQRQVSKALLGQIKGAVLSAETITDLGCGTGELLAACEALNPSAYLQGVDVSELMLQQAAQRGRGFSLVKADMQNTGIAANSQDLVLSSSAMQWVNVDRAFDEAARISKLGGRVAVACFLSDTLKEWRSLWGVDSGPLPTRHEVLAGAEAASLSVTYCGVKTVLYRANSFQAALANVRELGAGANRGASKGLMSRARFEAIKQRVAQQIDVLGFFPMEYEVIYLVADKHAQRQEGT